ncbi:MAG: 50S ribosomal protein L11 methyltransferase [Acidobacteria bacterium]|nr:50S ribosomal protein L11 methyltransferase [Acidobacteriota bacterium]
MKDYPAIDIRGDATDLLHAIVDDFAPTAIEERDASVRVFFSTADSRDAARAALAADFHVEAIDVPDEDWARRSQDSLTPITVGRITVAPPWAAARSPVASRQSSVASHQSPALSPSPSALVITIQPSMAFGTGHHATTRLCLAALQAVDLENLVVLDVGTGSGVLAMAAARLGAARAIGLDWDSDAIQSARENLLMNPEVQRVTFDLADLTSASLPGAQVVTANLTSALLVRCAPVLLGAVDRDGVLILSGLLADERDSVCRAFAPAAVCWEREEDGWAGLVMKKI